MDRIIDFSEIKNRVKDEDIDKFEAYMYELYYKMMEGKINMGDFSRELISYAQKNNISNDKFMKIQEQIMQRYGFDSSLIKDQLKNAGLNIEMPSSESYEQSRKFLGFHEKYKGRIKTKT